jgi:hypothetical protein
MIPGPCQDGGGKAALSSKTIQFNVWTWALWPLLPKHFREDPNAPLVVGAWFTIGNVALRFVTSEAITLWRKK